MTSLKTQVAQAVRKEFISGSVYRVDVDRVDVAPDGSAGVLRSLPLTGDRDKIKPGDPVRIFQVNGERVAVAGDVALAEALAEITEDASPVEIAEAIHSAVSNVGNNRASEEIPSKLGALQDVDFVTAPPANNTALVYDGTAQKWKPGTVTATTNASTFSGMDVGRFVYGMNGSKTDFVQNINNPLPSGFYDGYNVTGAPNGAWFHILHQRHDNTNNNYASQLAQQFGTDNLYIRDITEGVPSAWRLMLHEGIHFPRYARSYATIGLQIGTNALSPLPMNGVWLDTGGFWNTSYQTRLTAPVAGVYVCGGGFGIAAAQMTAAARVACYIRKNGSVYYAAGENYSAAGLDASVSCSGLVDLAAGDYIEMVALHTIGATRVVNPGSATYQHGANLWMMKVGG